MVTGSPPAGLSLTPSYGVYSACVYGTPTTVQTSAFTLQVRGGVGDTARQAFTLTYRAPAGGTVVNLASDHTYVATVPSSVTIPAGATSTTFKVTTHPVSLVTTVTISAAFDGQYQTAGLTLTPS